VEQSLIDANSLTTCLCLPQDKLGVVRQGQVYALFDFSANHDDELTFRDGDLMVVIRKGDER